MAAIRACTLMLQMPCKGVQALHKKGKENTHKERLEGIYVSRTHDRQRTGLQGEAAFLIGGLGELCGLSNRRIMK